MFGLFKIFAEPSHFPPKKGLFPLLPAQEKLIEFQLKPAPMYLKQMPELFVGTIGMVIINRKFLVYNNFLNFNETLANGFPCFLPQMSIF